MGQKVNPKGFRLGVIYQPSSKWYAEKNQYRDFVLQDIKLKRYLQDRLKLAGIVQVEIKRSINIINIYLHVSRPGVVIGRGGANLEALKKEVAKLLREMGESVKTKFTLDVKEVKKPDLSAKLIAERISEQLIKRYPHRRAVAQAIEKVMNAGAQGIKIQLSGRIAGAEIGRTEKYSQGKVPTQTLRADIDYAQVASLTRSGYVGIKVWIYRGEKHVAA